MDDMNDSESWAQRCGLHYQLSHNLRNLDAIKSLGLWMSWMTLGRELKVLEFMKNSGLWLTWTTPICGLQVVDAMKKLGLWMIWATLGHKLRTMDVINSSMLWMNEWLQIPWTHYWFRANWSQIRLAQREMNDLPPLVCLLKYLLQQ